MKKWLQNLSTAVIASLLAVTLSGKAYAEEQPDLPAEAPAMIEQPAAPAPVQEISAAAPPCLLLRRQRRLLLRQCLQLLHLP